MTSKQQHHPPNSPSGLGEEPRRPATQAAPDVRELTVGECWARLREKSVGRLAVVVERRPDLFPVNFVVNHGTVVFRTATGSKLLSAVQQPVAFEVDGWDEATGAVWSVVVRGRARKAREPYEVLDALTLPLTPWHRGAKPWFVIIEPESVTGRAFTPSGDPAE